MAHMSSDHVMLCGRPNWGVAPCRDAECHPPGSPICTRDVAAVGLGMAREGTYPVTSTPDGAAQLFSSRRLVRAVRRETNRLYAELAAPSVTFIRGPPRDDHTLQGWAQLVAQREVLTESLRFAARVRMAPSTHTPAHAEFLVCTARSPARGEGITWSAPALWCSQRP